MPFSNQNIIPSPRYINRNSRTSFKQQPKVKTAYNRGDTLVLAIANGDFDDKIIENFKYLKLDLKKSVSGAKWHDQLSTYRKLADNMGLNSSDDRIIRELYRVIMYNKRFIRDKLESKPNDDKVIVFKSVHYVEIQLPDPTPKTHETIPKNEIPVHLDFHLTRNNEPVKIERGPQPISEAELVDWGSNPVERLCPRCHHSGWTKIQYRIGCCTWTWVVSLVLSVLCLPCSWFPCALNCSKDTLHICPKCLYILGIMPRNICVRKLNIFKHKGGLTPYNKKKSESKDNSKPQKTSSNVIEFIPRDDDGASELITKESNLQHYDELHESEEPILPVSSEFEVVNFEGKEKYEDELECEDYVNGVDEVTEKINQKNTEEFIVNELFRKNMKITT